MLIKKQLEGEKKMQGNMKIQKKKEKKIEKYREVL